MKENSAKQFIAKNLLRHNMSWYDDLDLDGYWDKTVSRSSQYRDHCEIVAERLDTDPEIIHYVVRHFMTRVLHFANIRRRHYYRIMFPIFFRLHLFMDIKLRTHHRRRKTAVDGAYKPYPKKDNYDSTNDRFRRWK